MYSLKTVHRGGTDSSPCYINRAKGVSRTVVKKLTYEYYKEAIDAIKVARGEETKMGSSNHRIYKFIQKRQFFQSFDDKW